MSVAAIVLAAGRGTRFGSEPKLLALLSGTPLVRHAVEAAAASSLRPVLVVVGGHEVAIEAALVGLDCTLVRNPRYAEGLSTSLRAGFDALPAEAEGAAILLGDMPDVGAGLLDHLATAWREAGRPIALVPIHGGVRGNPVVLSRSLSDDIAALAGDVGAGLLLRGRPDVVELAMADGAVRLDIDTADALARRQASTTSRSTAT